MFQVPSFFRGNAGMPHDMSPHRAADAYASLAPVEWSHYLIAKSYREFTALVVIQYRALLAAGLSVEYVMGEPYGSSAEMHAHIETGNIRTRATGDDLATPGNPMLATVDGLLVNDMFRTVHDVVGHYATRSGFGPDGETVAWLEHRATMYPIMRLALWNETRGQAAWTNWADDHASMPLKDRPYADGLPRLAPVTII